MKIKRICSVAVAASLTGASLLYYSASAMPMGVAGGSLTIPEDDEEMIYVERVIGKYLRDTDYASLDGVCVSDAFPLHDLENSQICDKDIFVIYYKENVIGVLSVMECADSYYSVFRLTDVDCIQNAFDSKANIAFCCCNGESLMFDGSNFYNTQTGNLTDYILEDDSFVRLEPLDSIYGSLRQYAGNNTRGYYYCLEGTIEPVANTYKYSKGICWAASIAAKYNYEHGYYKGGFGYVDAVNVFDCVEREYGSRPTGIPACETLGLRHFGMYDTYYEGDVSATAIVAEIANDNPVLIGLKGSNKLSHITIYHSAMICGVEYNNDDSAMYEIVDPNCSTIQQAFVATNASESSSDFKYSPDYLAEYYSWYSTSSYRPENRTIGK